MIFVLAFLGILVAMLYSLYVALIRKKNDVQEAFSGIDVQLKKRYDLIPNMLKTAAKFMEHEKELFMQVTSLREQAMTATNYADKFKADGELSTALRAFNIRAENYPQLKSDATMVNAQKALAETEEHIAAARRFYNAAVKEYKNAIQIFPSSLVAALIGLKDEYPFFEAESEALKSVDVNEYFK
ncbi:MAG: LemA family protein [Alphaproteobacteria bacterium]|nr:LemA family protein [Alphaproteobacteria bacterium]